jgi:hypothetical protein
MIAADLEQLKFLKKKEFTSILEKEMDYVNRDLQGMTSSAALLAGFSYSAVGGGPRYWIIGDDFQQYGAPFQNGTNGYFHFQKTPIERFTGPIVHSIRGLKFLEDGFTAAATLAFVCNLLLVIYSTWVAMYGPNSALHLKDEAFLEVRLKKLRVERLTCLRLLWAGVFLFALSNVVSVWYVWRGDIALMATLVGIFFCWNLWGMYNSLRLKFDAPPLIPGIVFGNKCCRQKAADQRTLKKGFINHLSTTGWKRKFFVLTPDYFRYSKSHDTRYQGEFKFNKNMFFLVQQMNSATELLAIASKDAKYVFQMQSWLTTWVSGLC